MTGDVLGCATRAKDKSAASSGETKATTRPHQHAVALTNQNLIQLAACRRGAPRSRRNASTRLKRLLEPRPLGCSRPNSASDMPLMEVGSSPDGPDVATRFRRSVTHDNGGVFYSPAIDHQDIRNVDEVSRLTHDARQKRALLQVWSNSGSHFLLVNESPVAPPGLYLTPEFVQRNAQNSNER